MDEIMERNHGKRVLIAAGVTVERQVVLNSVLEEIFDIVPENGSYQNPAMYFSDDKFAKKPTWEDAHKYVPFLQLLILRNDTNQFAYKVIIDSYDEIETATWRKIEHSMFRYIGDFERSWKQKYGLLIYAPNVSNTILDVLVPLPINTSIENKYLLSCDSMSGRINVDANESHYCDSSKFASESCSARIGNQLNIHLIQRLELTILSSDTGAFLFRISMHNISIMKHSQWIEIRESVLRHLVSFDTYDGEKRAFLFYNRDNDQATIESKSDKVSQRLVWARRLCDRYHTIYPEVRIFFREGLSVEDIGHIYGVMIDSKIDPYYDANTKRRRPADLTKDIIVQEIGRVSGLAELLGINTKEDLAGLVLYQRKTEKKEETYYPKMRRATCSKRGYKHISGNPEDSK